MPSSASDIVIEEQVAPRKPQHETSATTVEGSKKLSLEGIDDENVDDYHTHLGSTRNDRKEMTRMGKIQELGRNYRPLSTLSFTVLAQSTWEFLLVTNTLGLIDGGLAGFFWSYIWSFIGIGLVNISLASMASMAPTSGGQYHWVSEFAPLRYQRFLSYITGWLATLSWQAGNAAGLFLVGTLIQALVTINYPDYSPANWQGTLMVWAVVAVMWVMNVYGARAMPIFQNVFLVLHVFGFLTLIVIFWILSSRTTAKAVFTEFTNKGGWSSMGLSLMIGQISALYTLIGADCAAHMSEEIRDAGVGVPRAVIRSYVLNGTLGLVFLISFLFTITSIDDALNDPTTYTFIWVFRQTVSTAGVNALTTIVILLLFASNLAYNLTTSRQTWAFARDKGLPFHGWIAKVDPKQQVPVNSITFSCLFTALLSLVYIGSSTALYAMISLNLVALMLTYCVSTGCALYRRLYHPELLPPARWALGRWGVPINVGGLLYSFFAFFWSFWPEATPVDAETFNWAVVMFMAVVILCGFDYLLRGRKKYKGPVTLVQQGWRASHSS